MNRYMKGLLLLCCMVYGMAVYGQDSSPLQGIWSYTVPEVPYGYEKGTIEFKQVDNQLTGVMKNANGTYNIREIKKENQLYTSTIYVDGTEVTINFDPKPDKITGVVKVEGYEIPITLTPFKE